MNYPLTMNDEPPMKINVPVEIIHHELSITINPPFSDSKKRETVCPLPNVRLGFRDPDTLADNQGKVCYERCISADVVFVTDSVCDVYIYI